MIFSLCSASTADYVMSSPKICNIWDSLSFVVISYMVSFAFNIVVVTALDIDDERWFLVIKVLYGVKRLAFGV